VSCPLCLCLDLWLGERVPVLHLGVLLLLQRHRQPHPLQRHEPEVQVHTGRQHCIKPEATGGNFPYSFGTILHRGTWTGKSNMEISNGQRCVMQNTTSDYNRSCDNLTGHGNYLNCHNSA
jgi:hypothetical protein